MNRTTLLAAALFVSLALNVFVGGAFVGAHLAGGGEKPPGPGPGPGMGPRNPVAAAVHTLPPEAQELWRQQLPEYAQVYGPKVREARRLTRQTMRGFGSEPLDTEKAIEDLRLARALEFESRQAMDRKLVEFAATLPQADRARFGEALARPPLGRGDRRRPALADR